MLINKPSLIGRLVLLTLLSERITATADDQLSLSKKASLFKYSENTSKKLSTQE